MYSKIYNYDILFLGLFLLFFSRLLSYIGVPSIVNFLHYGVFLLLWIWLLKYRARTDEMIFFTVTFFSIIISTVSNFNSITNAIMEFILITQPFVLYWIVTKLQRKPETNKNLFAFLIAINFLNFIFSFFQVVVLGHLGDDVRGIFLGLGMASHLIGAMAIENIILILILPIKKGKKIVLSLSQLAVLMWGDNKQSIAILGLCILIYILINIKVFKTFLKYLFVAVLGIIAFYFIATTVNPSLLVWVSIDKVTLGGIAKFEIFPRILSQMDGILKIIFGCGPGSTVGRLAQMLPEYSFFTNTLGATISPITSLMWDFQQANYYSNSTTGSSMWMNFFSVSGIFGDLGIFGLSVILGGYLYVYKKLCNPYAKLILINVIIHGFVFQWWEEPAYMAYSIIIILLINDGRILSKKNVYI